MKWILWAAISLSIVISDSALANIDIEPEATSLICFNPNSGQQYLIDQDGEPSAMCAAGFESFPQYEFERSPGAEPLTYKTKQQEQAEVSDAHPDKE